MAIKSSVNLFKCPTMNKICIRILSHYFPYYNQLHGGNLSADLLQNQRYFM